MRKVQYSFCTLRSHEHNVIDVVTPFFVLVRIFEEFFLLFFSVSKIFRISLLNAVRVANGVWLQHWYGAIGENERQWAECQRKINTELYYYFNRISAHFYGLEMGKEAKQATTSILANNLLPPVPINTHRDVRVRLAMVILNVILNQYSTELREEVILAVYLSSFMLCKGPKTNKCDSFSVSSNKISFNVDVG